MKLNYSIIIPLSIELLQTDPYEGDNTTSTFPTTTLPPVPGKEPVNRFSLFIVQQRRTVFQSRPVFFVRSDPLKLNFVSKPV